MLHKVLDTITREAMPHTQSECQHKYQAQKKVVSGWAASGASHSMVKRQHGGGHMSNKGEASTQTELEAWPQVDKGALNWLPYDKPYALCLACGVASWSDRSRLLACGQERSDEACQIPDQPGFMHILQTLLRAPRKDGATAYCGPPMVE